METVIKGKSIVYNYDDISTDQIFPGKYVNLTDKADIVEHILEGADITLKDRIKTGKILVVGENFGCGSSREHAVIGIKESGIEVVLAGSAGRIWYRNAINLALPVIFCKDIGFKVTEGDILEINLQTGEINNITKSELYIGEPVSEFILDVFKKGGLKNMIQELNATDSKN